MIGVPAPFVAALLLAIVTVSHRESLHGSAAGRLFAAALWLTVASLALVGLRWSLDLVRLLPLLALSSAAATAALYLGFRSLGREGPAWDAARDWPHALPALAVLATALLFPRHTDPVLVAIKLGYAGALAALARRSDEALQLVRIGRLVSVRQALWAAAALTLGGAALDVAIAIDFARHGGRHAPVLVGLVSLAVALLLGWTAVLAGDGRALRAADAPADGGADPDAPEGATAERREREAPGRVDPPAPRSHGEPDEPDGDAVLVHRLDRLLLDERLFADPELSLQRLARKAGVPARAVSRAVNGRTGLNVSRWVNRARIDEACRLLADETMSVTRAMEESGFLTKSNFHREFRRVHGCSPTEWRARLGSAPSGPRRPRSPAR